jgi:hypothetical protein
MGIPDPTIDPITGLPILDTSPIVQQIPLGRQTTDFAAWKATAQPTRAPIFPDDGFPLFANVQGQHPDTGNAQSVHTDGNNRLLVSGDSPSGGGSPTPQKMYSGNRQFGSGDDLSGTGNGLGILPDTVKYIYGWSITVSPGAFSNTGSSHADVVVYLMNEGGSATQLMLYWPVWACSGGALLQTLTTREITIMLPTPIDVVETLGVMQTDYGMLADCNQLDHAAVFWTIFCQ